MRAISHSVLLLGLVFGLVVCGGDSNDDSVVRNDTYFTAFVKNQLAADPNGEPVNINNRNFRFTNQENPDAYDDVLSSNN